MVAPTVVVLTTVAFSTMTDGSADALRFPPAALLVAFLGGDMLGFVEANDDGGGVIAAAVVRSRHRVPIVVLVLVPKDIGIMFALPSEPGRMAGHGESVLIPLISTRFLLGLLLF